MNSKSSPDNSADSLKNSYAMAARTEHPDKNPDIFLPEKHDIPEREAKTWCSYMEREYRAARNSMDKEPHGSTGSGDQPPDE